MEETRDDLTARFDELSRTVEELRARLTLLESAVALAPAPAGATPVALPPRLRAEPARAEPARLPANEELQPEGLIPALGWALLGIAGAYLLRAMTGAGAIAGLLATGAGVAYAGCWLVFAARRAADNRLHSAVFALTAALILAPMLWETTVRFRLLPVESASAVLVAFVLLGLTIAWKRNVSSIASIVTLTALGTAAALFRETHNTTAWIVTVLVVAAAVEFSACRDRWLRLRWIVAAVADLTVLLVTVMATLAPSPAEALAPPSLALALASQIALLTIYLSSTVDRTLFRKLPIIRFEIGQTTAAFLISILGALRLAGIDHAAAAGVGWFCLTGGAACYLVSFAFLGRTRERDHNFYAYSTFAILLTVAGCRVLLADAALAAVWPLFAGAAVCAALLSGRGTLRLHSAAYLILAVVAAGLVPQALGHIMGASAQAASLPSNGYLFVLAGSALCYLAILRFGNRAEDDWMDHAQAALAAASVCLAVTGLAASWVYRYLSPAAPLRTALITALALAAAWSGLHWRRRELAWLAYPLMALSGFKLITEDFQQGRSLTLFASLIFFGGGLILLPRLLRRRAGLSPGRS
ncbi:MAG: hypothetical protein P4K98_12485 [Bryobacteraceae bacterium]|nr:hypothetical protein [Bryobacteraceae bacterium]